MPNSIGAQGLALATQSELYTNLSSAMKTIYGQNINLNPDSPDAQWLNIIVQAILDLAGFVANVNAGFDPDQAVGTVLDQRVAINGITRSGGTFTITPINVTTSQACTLPGLDQSAVTPYTVQDNQGNQWQLISTQNPSGAGTFSYSFQSAVPGAITTIPNTITTPVTIVIGVVAVINPTSYTILGENEESDAALRIRRRDSVSLSSQGYNAGLTAALENINGITSANVYENDTGSTDGNGVPGNSIWAIVAGSIQVPLAAAWSSTTTYAYGNIASSGGVNYISIQDNNTNNVVTNTNFWALYNPIAQAIYAKRNAGCGMYGSQTYLLIQKSGTPILIKWDYVEAQNLFIKFTATSLNGIDPPNIAAIVAQLPTIFTPGVDAQVNINDLATLVQQIDPNTLVTNAGFSTSSGGSYTNTLKPTALNFQFIVSTANIIVLPMILNPVTVNVPTLGSQTFKGLGGYGTLTYHLFQNNSGGSINSSTGVYTAGSTPNVVDIVTVTDSLANNAASVILVGS